MIHWLVNNCIWVQCNLSSHGFKLYRWNFLLYFFGIPTVSDIKHVSTNNIIDDLHLAPSYSGAVLSLGLNYVFIYKMRAGFLLDFSFAIICLVFFLRRQLSERLCKLLW